MDTVIMITFSLTLRMIGCLEMNGMKYSNDDNNKDNYNYNLYLYSAYLRLYTTCMLLYYSQGIQVHGVYNVW